MPRYAANLLLEYGVKEAPRSFRRRRRWQSRLLDAAGVIGQLRCTRKREYLSSFVNEMAIREGVT